MASKSDQTPSKKKSGKPAARAGLPFEPNSDRPGPSQKAADGSAAKAKQSDQSKKSKNNDQPKSSVSAKAEARVEEIRAMKRRRAEKRKADSSAQSADSGEIPEVVSRRMLRRMAVLSGSPVFLGVGIFFLAYYLRSREIVEFPPVAVLLVTMGCFGLGVLGLTYGVLSASWDDEPGGLVGLREFKLNFGRVMDARRASKT
ncbi:MAG: PAM68 family protein [Phormidesmis sp.]